MSSSPEPPQTQGSPAPQQPQNVNPAPAPPPDNYGLRIKKYQRREQMATWVVAGIAALIGFVAAHALEGAPRIFTPLVFTFAIAAGAAAALTRVGFEWQATLLKRKMREKSADSNTILDEVDRNWPALPEHYWTACLSTITLAWVIMIVGIWWPRVPTQVTIPAVADYAELHTIPLGGVGPFADCDAELPPNYKGQLDLLVQNYRDHTKSNVRAALIILLGTADNRHLSKRCASHFATNEELALMRATNVRTKLELMLSGEPLKPSYVTLTSGPRHLEAKAEGQGWREDRVVGAWVATDPRSSGVATKP
jgi:hypothetical protein